MGAKSESRAKMPKEVKTFVKNLIISSDLSVLTKRKVRDAYSEHIGRKLENTEKELVNNLVYKYLDQLNQSNSFSEGNSLNISARSTDQDDKENRVEENRIPKVKNEILGKSPKKISTPSGKSKHSSTESKKNGSLGTPSSKKKDVPNNDNRKNANVSPGGAEKLDANQVLDAMLDSDGQEFSNIEESSSEDEEQKKSPAKAVPVKHKGFETQSDLEEEWKPFPDESFSRRSRKIVKKKRRFIESDSDEEMSDVIPSTSINCTFDLEEERRAEKKENTSARQFVIESESQSDEEKNNKKIKKGSTVKINKESKKTKKRTEEKSKDWKKKNMLDISSDSGDVELESEEDCEQKKNGKSAKKQNTGQKRKRKSTIESSSDSEVNENVSKAKSKEKSSAKNTGKNKSKESSKNNSRQKSKRQKIDDSSSEDELLINVSKKSSVSSEKNLKNSKHKSPSNGKASDNSSSEDELLVNVSKGKTSSVSSDKNVCTGNSKLKSPVKNKTSIDSSSEDELLIDASEGKINSLSSKKVAKRSNSPRKRKSPAKSENESSDVNLTSDSEVEDRKKSSAVKNSDSSSDSSSSEDDEPMKKPTKSKPNSKAKNTTIKSSKTVKNSDSESDSSSSEDEEPVKKPTKSKPNSKAKSSTNKSSKTVSDGEEESKYVKKLKNLCFRCGRMIRNSTHLKGLTTNRKKVKVLKAILRDLGMEGEPSEQKVEDVLLKKEAASLCLDNIISDNRGIGKRSARSKYSNSRISKPKPNYASPVKFNSIKDLIDSEESD